jgi:hypothetical protein
VFLALVPAVLLLGAGMTLALRSAAAPLTDGEWPRPIFEGPFKTLAIVVGVMGVLALLQHVAGFRYGLVW